MYIDLVRVLFCVNICEFTLWLDISISVHLSSSSFDSLSLTIVLFKFAKGEHTGDGSLDIKGNNALKASTGNWRACPYILGK